MPDAQGVAEGRAPVGCCCTLGCARLLAVTFSCPPAPQKCNLGRWARHTRHQLHADRSRGKKVATVAGCQGMDVVVKAVAKVVQTLQKAVAKIPGTQPVRRLKKQRRCRPLHSCLPASLSDCLVFLVLSAYPSFCRSMSLSITCIV